MSEAGSAVPVAGLRDGQRPARSAEGGGMSACPGAAAGLEAGGWAARQVALAMLAVLAWLLAWYPGTAAEMARIWWRSDTFAHGMVVLPICAWLVWRERATLGPPQPGLWALPLVVLAGLAWLLGRLAAVDGLAHFALAALLVAGLGGVLGLTLTRQLAFALLFVFFAVPVGDFLLPALMDHTAAVTVAALRLSGVPVYQEGLHFIVPNGRWSVVEACSGIRYLIASLMVGTLYAWLNYRSPLRRALFVLFAALLPVVANWLRAYLIVMLGYLSDNRLAAGVDHLVYGWLFFGLVMLFMFAIGARWRQAPEVLAAPRQAPAAAHGWRRLWPLLPLALASALWPLLEARMNRPVADFGVELLWPAALPGWQPQAGEDGLPVPQFAGARGQFRQRWLRDGQAVSLHVHFYAAQGPGHELVSWGNRLVADDAGWRLIEQTTDNLAVGEGGAPATVRRSLLEAAGRRVLVWSWYWMDGRVLVSDARAKAYKGVDRLLGRGDAGAHVALMVPVEDEGGADEGGAARARAAAFAAAAAPGLAQMLHGAARVGR